MYQNMNYELIIRTIAKRNVCATLSVCPGDHTTFSGELLQMREHLFSWVYSPVSLVSPGLTW